MIKKLNSLTVLFIITMVMVILMLLTLQDPSDSNDDDGLLFPTLWNIYTLLLRPSLPVKLTIQISQRLSDNTAFKCVQKLVKETAKTANSLNIT